MDSIKKHNVCKRCLLETDNSGQLKDGEHRPNEGHLVDAIKLAVDDIDKNIKCKRVWKNPIDDSNNLCEECQYKLEHYVFDDAEEIDELKIDLVDKKRNWFQNIKNKIKGNK